VKTERRASDSDESNVARVEAKRKADSLYKWICSSIDSSRP